MKHRLHRLGRLLPVVALLGVMYGSPVVAQTTDQAQASPPASSVAALQARMKSIRETTDPAHRMVLMEEQIKALEAASQGAFTGCPMMGGQAMGDQMMKGGAPAAGTGPMGRWADGPHDDGSKAHAGAHEIDATAHGHDAEHDEDASGRQAGDAQLSRETRSGDLVYRPAFGSP